MDRQRLLEMLAEEVAGLVDGHPLLVAIDGVDGAGKTVFADEFADVLRRHGLEVVRASVDGFHHPARRRYRRGRTSPEGFFLDSYDYAALTRLLLDPLRPKGSRRIVRAVHDVASDETIDAPVEVVGGRLSFADQADAEVADLREVPAILEEWQAGDRHGPTPA